MQASMIDIPNLIGSDDAIVGFNRQPGNHFLDGKDDS
jgi:hypothetical protein